ncbi:cell division protein CrgA [Arthrobacter sp. CAU 1506]|uniref:cell division protein CrgA n=1 Tax=Arthrobacter sp. CAU 1506 TaxID=2560052 RepID=UPI0010AB9F4D|nr:cell division protein CrgA [Arthrobacter sp. CAU 1506]TJY70046.1 cell division protein CrgA [Arthrobacter sp. CAU 1506]
MPESKRRKRTERRPEELTAKGNEPNAAWFKPVMFGLMIVGLLWIIVFYITQGAWPLAAAGSWNIMIGFGIAIAGFLMTTRWRS